MELIIDLEDATPIYTQLVTRIKKAIEQGQLAPGAPLPSIRQLANDLDVNSKTVAKAYRLLERDTVIESRGYRGTYVHKNAKQNCAVNINEIIEQQLKKALMSLKQLGATDSEIRIVFNKLMTATFN
jgi:GntR family transcriptional regulator